MNQTVEDAAAAPTARQLGQRQVARARLATGGTYAEAAETAGVSERTVSRWMAEADFARSVSEARAEQLQIVTGQLTTLATEAVAVLSDTMRTGTTGQQLKAAQMVLSWATRLRHDTELEARLLEVEARLGLAPSLTEGATELEEIA